MKINKLANHPKYLPGKQFHRNRMAQSYIPALQGEIIILKFKIQNLCSDVTCSFVVDWSCFSIFLTHLQKLWQFPFYRISIFVENSFLQKFTQISILSNFHFIGNVL